MNNDFFVTSEAIRQSLPNRLTSDKKIVIHGNECIILFLTCYFMWWTHKSAKNYHRALISPLLPRAAFFWPSIVTSSQLICDVSRTRNTAGFYTKGRPLVKSNLICPSDKLSWRPGCPVLNNSIQGYFCISQGNGSSDNLPELLV